MQPFTIQVESNFRCIMASSPESDDAFFPRTSPENRNANSISTIAAISGSPRRVKYREYYIGTLRRSI